MKKRFNFIHVFVIALIIVIISGILIPDIVNFMNQCNYYSTITIMVGENCKKNDVKYMFKNKNEIVLICCNDVIKYNILLEKVILEINKQK